MKAEFKKLLSRMVKYANNPWILDIIKFGLKLDFVEHSVYNNNIHCNLTQSELQVIDAEVNKLLSKKVISVTSYKKY